MNLHWHVGFNSVGFLPNPDDCYAVRTPEDALRSLVEELGLAYEDDGDLTAGNVAEQYRETLLGCFNENGFVDWVKAVPGSPEQKILTALVRGELVVVADGAEYWVKVHKGDCVDLA